MLIASGRLGRTEGTRIHLTRDYGETWQTPAEFSFHVEGLALGAVARPCVGVLRHRQRAVQTRSRPWGGAGVDPGGGGRACQAVLRRGGRLRAGRRPAGRGGRPGTRRALSLLPGRTRRDLPAARAEGRRRTAAADPADAGPPLPADRRVRDRRQPRGRGEPARTPAVPGVPGRLEGPSAPTGSGAVAATWSASATGSSPPPPSPRSASATPPAKACRGARPRWTADCRCARSAGSSRCSRSPSGGHRVGRGATCCWPAAWAASTPRPTHGPGSTPASSEFTERVSLPRTWLFAPGEHKLTVRYDDARE